MNSHDSSVTCYKVHDSFSKTLWVVAKQLRSCNYNVSLFDHFLTYTYARKFAIFCICGLWAEFRLRSDQLLFWLNFQLIYINIKFMFQSTTNCLLTSKQITILIRLLFKEPVALAPKCNMGSTNTHSLPRLCYMMMMSVFVRCWVLCIFHHSPVENVSYPYLSQRSAWQNFRSYLYWQVSLSENIKWNRMIRYTEEVLVFLSFDFFLKF